MQMFFAVVNKEDGEKVKKLSKSAKLLISFALCLAVVFSILALNGNYCVKADGGTKYIIEGDVRVQVLSEDVFRIELKSSTGFLDDATLQIAGKNDYSGADFSVKTAGDYRVVSIGDYNVYIPLKAKTLNGVYVKDMNTRKKVWTYTPQVSNSGELPMPASTPEIFAINDNPRIIEPKNGYAPGSSDALSGFVIDEGVKDIYLIAAGGDAKKLRSEYVKLTGRTPMIPLSAFGLWESRYYEYTEESAKSVVQEYYDHDFYLDNFVIDTDWRRSPSDAAGTGYEINTDLFPDIAEFFDWMHEHNLTVMANDHVKMAAGAAHALSPVDVEYRTNGLLSLLEKGLDVWWYDRNWGFGLISPTSNINRETWGMYIYTSVTEKYFEQLAKENGDEYPRRAFIMANVDNIANGTYSNIQNVMSHRYPLQWTGDISSTGASLEQEVANMIKAGNSGIVYESSDLGGHNGKPKSEQYLHWMQYGALSPIYRTHGNNSISMGRTPWNYGEYETEVVRDYLSMRYHLLPVYYALAHENYMTGMPLMRSLEFDYPGYEESSRLDEYLLGENILVAPISNNATVAPASEFSGLQIAYYNNIDMSGSPVITVNAQNVAFDWGNNAPAAGVSADNFSAVITGKFTPAEDGEYFVISDDGCRVYIDGKCVVDHWMASDSDQINLGVQFTAGRTYDLRIEYYEGSGGAKILLYKNDGNKRTVFIPDGEWIDVWTGKTYVGPQTISVVHGSNTSPIFVKAGSAIALAEDMLNTREKDWSNLAIDWYPSTKASSQSILYEDDTTTIAYQDGQYRETTYGTRYNAENGTIELYIDAAKGSFKGERAFTDRTWKIRLHAPNGWGAPTEILLDGKPVDAEFIQRDYRAVPFSYNGAAPDDDVYEFTFTSAITQGHVISVKFASEDRVDRPADPEVDSFDLDAVGLESEDVDLSGRGVFDYAIATYDDNKINLTRSLSAVKSPIGQLQFSGGQLKNPDDAYKFKLKGEDGYLSKAVSTVNGGKFTATVTTESTGAFRIYLGGNNSTGTLNISDNFGNTQTMNISSQEKYLRAIDVNCLYGGETTYTITYSADSGEIYWSGIAIKGDETTFSLTEKEIDRTHGVDFTSPVYSDYAFYKHTDNNWDTGTYKEYKKPGVENSGIGQIVYTDNGVVMRPVLDNIPVKVDGEDALIRSTIYTTTGCFDQNVTVSGKGIIHVFIGGYKSQVVLTVTDPDGISRSITTGNTGTNFYRDIQISYDVDAPTEYKLHYENAPGFENAVYSGVAIQPYVERDYDLNVNMMGLDSAVDLTVSGNQDWYYFNEGNDNPGKFPARKNLPESDRLISEVTLSPGATLRPFWDYKAYLYFSDGIRQSNPGAADITTWSTALFKGVEYTSVKVNGDTDYIRLYLSSWHNGGLLTIKDGGEIVYQDIVIYCADDAGSGYGRYVEIRVNTYGQEKTFDLELCNAFEKDGTNVALVAVAVGSDVADIDRQPTMCSNYTMQDYSGGDELAKEGVKDWFTFGSSLNKLNGEYFGTVSGSDIINSGVKQYNDLKVNGAQIDGLTTGKNGIHVDVMLKAKDEITLTLYMGTWNATAVVIVTDVNGNIVVRESFNAGADAQFKKLTVNLTSAVKQTLRVDVLTTARNGNGVSFVAAGNVLPATTSSHNYKVTVLEEATCQKEGLMHYECVICGDSYDEKIEKTDHSYEDQVVPPTCTEGGYTVHTCKWCGDSYTDNETEATGHDYDEEIIPPTCTEQGYTDYYCINCGDNYKDDYVDALGHTESNWIVDKEATCTETGKRHIECEVCGTVLKTETIPVTEHSYGAWTVVKPATCQQEGEQQRVCEVCGDVATQAVPVTEHSYESVVTQPTCTEGGYTTYTCTVCGDSYVGNETEALGHTWDEGVITTQPTTDSEGVKTYTCTVCGETKTEPVDKLPGGTTSGDSSGCANCSSKALDGSAIAMTLSALLAMAFVLRRKK